MQTWEKHPKVGRFYILTHESGVLPLTDGRVIEVRKPSRPDAEQARVYHLLGIDSMQACPARKFVMKSNRTENEMVAS